MYISYISLSLSISLYIERYLSSDSLLRSVGVAPNSEHLRKGPNGVNTNGVTAKFMFFDRDFLGTPVNLLLSSQKCQGVPFFQTCQHTLLLQRPN